MHYELDETWMPFTSLMLKHIYNVLLICSEYDRFMLEEDGRVEEELFQEYMSLGLSNPPKITHVSNEHDALNMIESQQFDLVISMLDLGTGRVEVLAEEVKKQTKDECLLQKKVRLLHISYLRITIIMMSSKAQKSY